MIININTDRQHLHTWKEFAYGVHNTRMDDVMSVPPCQQYPGMPKEAT